MRQLVAHLCLGAILIRNEAHTAKQLIMQLKLLEKTHQDTSGSSTDPGREQGSASEKRGHAKEAASARRCLWRSVGGGQDASLNGTVRGRRGQSALGVRHSLSWCVAVAKVRKQP